MCSVKIITRHVKIWTHVQEWTHVCNPTYPVITFTGYKSHPYKNDIVVITKRSNYDIHLLCCWNSLIAFIVTSVCNCFVIVLAFFFIVFKPTKQFWTIHETFGPSWTTLEIKAKGVGPYEPRCSGGSRKFFYSDH